MSALGKKLGHLVLPRYMIREDRKKADDFDTRQMYSTFVRIAWPALLESFLIGVIAFVDSLMVSGCGEEAIAAVGLTGQPRLLFYVVLMSITTGVNAVVARRRGEGNREGANRTLMQALPIVFLLATLFFVVSLFVAEPLLRFAGAKDDTIGMAIPYYNITMFGMIFTSVSLCINAAHRGCGKTKISMTTNIAANVVNVIFNALLINGLLGFPKLGVTGAAIATALGNFVSAVIAIFSLYRKDGYLRMNIGQMVRHKFETLPSVMKVFSGSALEQVFLRIGFFLFVKMVADLGTKEYATHQICMNVMNLSFTVGDGLGIASASLVGQHLGMQREDKSLVYGKVGQRVGLCYGVLLLTLFLVFGGHIVGWFSDDPAIIQTGIKLMMMLAAICPFQISQVIFSGCLRGAGDTRYMAVVSMLTVALLRPILTYILVYPVEMGVIGAWIAILVDQTMRFGFSAVRFYSQKWCKVKL
ncbi:MAG: MATE family efflux transporter [Clostridia bacterium]|nr:MATE family efflux transporter [Clostridia bacterium]